jgi:hypothetical protein
MQQSSYALPPFWLTLATAPALAHIQSGSPPGNGAALCRSRAARSRRTPRYDADTDATARRRCRRQQTPNGTTIDPGLADAQFGVSGMAPLAVLTGWGQPATA